MTIADRIWLEWELKCDRYPDGLTGAPPFDIAAQEARGIEAELSFSGALSATGPPMPQGLATGESAQRMQEGWNQRIAKARRIINREDEASDGD